jgi:hypothetical protein
MDVCQAKPCARSIPPRHENQMHNKKIEPSLRLSDLYLFHNMQN